MKNQDQERIDMMNDSFIIGKVKKSSLTTEECQKSSLKSSMKGLKNAFKNSKDEPERKNKK